MEACTGVRREAGSRDTTPNPPNTRCAGNCRKPDRQPYAGGGESGGPCGTRGAVPRAAPWRSSRRRSRLPSPARCGSGRTPRPPTAPGSRAAELGGRSEASCAGPALRDGGPARRRVRSMLIPDKEAIPVCGTLSIGLFASQATPGGINADGLFFGGGFGLLMNQFIGVLAVGAFTFGFAFVVCGASSRRWAASVCRPKRNIAVWTCPRWAWRPTPRTRSTYPDGGATAVRPVVPAGGRVPEVVYIPVGSIFQPQ